MIVRQVNPIFIHRLWVDYSAVSTIVGWSSFTVNKIYTKQIGKIVFVNFDIEGVSNSINTSFTVPYISAVNPGSHRGQIGLTFDNGSALATPGAFYLPAGGNIVTLYKDSALTGWTASGNKYVLGRFWYEMV